MNRNHVAIGLFLLLIVTGGAFASGHIFETEGTINVNATDGPSITTSDSIEGTSDYLTPDPNTIDFGVIRFESQGPTAATVSGIGADSTTLSDLDVAANTLTVASSDKQTIELSGNLGEVTYRDVDLQDTTTTELDVTGDGTISVHGLPENDWVLVDGATTRAVQTDGSGTATFSATDESISLQATEGPQLSNPAPTDGEVVSNPPALLEVNLSHSDFGSDPDLDVTLTWRVNGTVIATETVSQNGTYTQQIQASPGANNWSVEAEDSYSHTDSSGPHEFGLPDELEVRDVETGECIGATDTEITLQYFENGDEITDTRQLTDCSISLEGLPGNTEYIVTAQVDGYETQRIVLPNIIEQQTLWMVSTNANTIFNQFTLNDDSGRFTPSETKLIIEAPINGTDGETRYRQFSGDYFGAGDTYETALLQGERYRLIVENQDGDRRTIGSYVAESEGLVTLDLGEIEWPQPEDTSYTIDIGVIEENGQSYIEVLYTDNESRTDSLEVRVENRYDSEDVLFEEQVSNPTNYRALIPINESQKQTQWVVNYTADRNPTVSGAIPVAGENSLNVPLPTQWLSAFAVIFIVIIAAAYPGSLSGIGGIVTVSMAGIGIAIGWLNIPVLAWFVAATIAALGLVLDANRGGVT
jgi:hypothetical protein